MKIKIIILATCIFFSMIFSGCGNKNSSTVYKKEVETQAVTVQEDATVEERLADLELKIESMEEELALMKTEAAELRNMLQEPEPAASLEQEIENYINKLTIEEKVAQMFIVLPEDLMTGVSGVVAAGDTTRNAINEIPVGGFIYMSQNLQSEEQVKTMLSNVQTYSMERIGLPAFLCVDEEGGTVTRISGTGKFNVPEIGDMRDIGDTTDISAAYEVGMQMGEYLSELGFNVDFAPVADVYSNPENTVVKRRSFGSDPEMVSEMSAELSKGLLEKGVYSTYKHFPGHGSTAGDTHAGYAYTDKTLEELMACELIPFSDGIDKEVPFIMIGHISLPNVTGDYTPASLSEKIITDLLRNQMGYDGIVITDALNMGAIVNDYSSANASVKAIKAGVDILLMPSDFYSAYNGVLNAVESGEISEERINESLRRILKIKVEIK